MGGGGESGFRLFVFVKNVFIVLLLHPTDYYHDCREAMAGAPHTGIHTIKPDNLPPFDVCILNYINFSLAKSVASTEGR